MLGTRLKAARIRAGYSQKQLGMLVGMDEFSASARMNQYERERHSPNMRTSEQLAMVLQVPMAYLYCPEDEPGRAHPQGVQPDTRVQERADAFHRTVARGPGINQPPACTHKE